MTDVVYLSAPDIHHCVVHMDIMYRYFKTFQSGCVKIYRVKPRKL